MADLPPPRTPGEYRIALVCLGNICRSPMAHVVLAERVAEAGLADRVTLTSSGTGGWHVGNPMDDRAAATLTHAGYDASRHRARRFEPAWLDELDLALAMDRQNLADLADLADPVSGRRERVRLFRDFDPQEPGGEVPDPYYGGSDGFEEVLTMVERTAASLVDRLALVLAGHRADPPGSRSR
ncbi:low molecular weight protein-tyrosine-phosphatase [Nocardioides panaciterrulae]|uniref:protein-tyrosine-phosphatase n=1 Tax=Nocardioides panaciterrulae TaxID=661492 RepID=A0A7Y9J957_9ACTN|nr:low molecular weight protein-tyrosine-phosphatase [Nocardioides panaciterrulae]NYD40180.1 protein-tyrosine phosphatase [Nocardioides panaciterrulae]